MVDVIYTVEAEPNIDGSITKNVSIKADGKTRRELFPFPETATNTRIETDITDYLTRRGLIVSSINEETI